MANLFYTLIPIVAVIVIVVMLPRAFWCWYWKINRIVELLEQQTLLLKRQLEISEEARDKLEQDI
jgi:hypothetical protein